PFAENVHGDVPVVCDPDWAVSGATFPVGTTQVDCTAEDAFGQQATGSFSVTVDLPPAPTMDPVSNILVTSTNPAGMVVEYDLPSAEDFDGNDLGVTCTPAPGTLFPLGETEVTCVSEPDLLDRTVERSFTVNVRPAASLAPTFTS